MKGKSALPCRESPEGCTGTCEYLGKYLQENDFEGVDRVIPRSMIYNRRLASGNFASRNRVGRREIKYGCSEDCRVRSHREVGGDQGRAFGLRRSLRRWASRRQ